MYWVILIGSGMFEAVWATALAKSDGLRVLVPTIVFFAACGISMSGLAWALREIPVGTGYAVWTAIGALTTAAWAMATGAEPVSILRVLFFLGIIACVVGLKCTTPAP